MDGIIALPVWDDETGAYLEATISAKDAWRLVRRGPWRTVYTRKEEGRRIGVYVVEKGSGQRLHEILRPEIVAGGFMVDHGNHNTFDNTDKNLRPATRSENSANSRKRVRAAPGRPCTSQYKGVTRRTGRPGASRPWLARIQQGKTIYLGVFATETEAAAAYDEAALRLFPKHAYTNAMAFRDAEQADLAYDLAA